MTTYTTVADSNGDFIVPFSTEYSSGEKVTVTAEKDGAIKSIELFAPSEATGGGVIQFSGNMIDFPWNIGNITLEQGIGESIGNYAFYAAQSHLGIFKRATGLSINAEIKNIGRYAFFDWSNAAFLNLPPSIESVDERAFQLWQALTSVSFPASLKTIGSFAFLSSSVLSTVIFNSAQPPVCGASIFSGADPNLKIYVPSQSFEAYQSAEGLSEYASIMSGY